MNILLPLKFNLILAIILFILPDYKKFIRIFAPVIALLNFALSIFILINSISQSLNFSISQFILWDNLSKLIYFFIGFFGLLLAIYSAGFIKERLNKYFSYFFLTLFAAYGIVLSKNWIAFAVFWGISAFTLYLLMQFNSEASSAAKKALIILGGSDGFLILAIALIYQMNGSFNLLPTRYSLLAICSLLIASFAKAGNMPLHTWIPPCADKAPVPVTAFLPASLDKLLGIYLLARIFYLFSIPSGFRILVMTLGAITIICAVYMALAQHTAKKLLSYHAVSQVGYMVLAIGTGNPLGIAGGLFHMVNNAIYKSCLFLGAGQVERAKDTDELEKLGGLSKFLPITFICMLIASFSISGIPPFNGFYSKWLIYQGVLSSLSTRYSLLATLCLIAALFGSALTLASFMKLIHAIFLGAKTDQQVPLTPTLSPEGRGRKGERSQREKISLVFPQIVLAISCIILGIFAQKLFIRPVFGEVLLKGIWFPETALILILAGIALGLLIYLISRVKFRRARGYIGGERISPQMHISGVEFYSSIENIFPFRQIYNLAGKKVFDIYDLGAKLTFFFTKGLRGVHTGILPEYMRWCLVGMLILFFALLK